MERGKSKLQKRIKRSSRKRRNPPPPWIQLPGDVTANILHRLGAIEIIESAQKVCTTWRKVCMDPAMWRAIDMRNTGDLDDMPYDLDIMCRHAVDLSQGQLVDINIEHFGTDDLLHYIAQQSSQLRSLRIANCDDIDGEPLSKAVAKFPLLEELHLIFIDVSAGDVEAIGLSCPMLKSFTCNVMGYYKHPVSVDDGMALAVAKTMPGLQHLRLLGDKMTGKGLQAILDGCPHLESLDLRKCFNIALDGDLGKRCSQQIKNLKRPLDSTGDRGDYEWVAEDADDYAYDSADSYFMGNFLK